MSIPLSSPVTKDTDDTGATSRRLVFGDDGSEAADVAWLWISEHPWPGWQIDVLTAEPPGVGTLSTDEAGPEARPWRPPHPRHILASSRPSESTPVRHLLARADPRLVLGDQRDARLIVIGHRGRGVLKSMTIGSTADWLLHRPPAPLAIIRSGRQARRILLCYDGSTCARAAVTTLAGMPWIVGCQVTVLGVSHGDTRLTSAITEAAAVLEQAQARPHPCHREALSHSVGFDVRATILDVIHHQDPDLVVLGTRGLGLGRRFLTGSVAVAVTHHAPCSILTVMVGSLDAPGGTAVASRIKLNRPVAVADAGRPALQIVDGRASATYHDRRQRALVDRRL